MNQQQEREISGILSKIRHHCSGLRALRRVAKSGYSQCWFEAWVDALIVSYNEHLFRQCKKLRTALRIAGLNLKTQPATPLEATAETGN